MTELIKLRSFLVRKTATTLTPLCEKCTILENPTFQMYCCPMGPIPALERLFPNLTWRWVVPATYLSLVHLSGWMFVPLPKQA